MIKFRWQSSTRYYLTFIYQDLLGDWIVHRAWGSLFNALGSEQCDVVSSKEDGLRSVEDIHKRRTQRKYEFVIQGATQ